MTTSTSMPSWLLFSPEGVGALLCAGSGAFRVTTLDELPVRATRSLLGLSTKVAGCEVLLLVAAGSSRDETRAIAVDVSANESINRITNFFLFMRVSPKPELLAAAEESLTFEVSGAALFKLVKRIR
jgi:hypothetical protein